MPTFQYMDEIQSSVKALKIIISEALQGTIFEL